MSEPFEARISSGARRALAERLPLGVAAAILEFIAGTLAENPRRLGKPLTGQLAGCHSARRGSYRVVYRIIDETNVIDVLRVDHRRIVYDR